MATPSTSYVGRFAPSPTGNLHLGSLFSAVASYLDAKAHNGTWLLRIEDIDPPREQQGAAKSIIDALLAHGLKPDQTISYQSHNSKAYEKNIAILTQQKMVFYCSCSRKDLASYQGFYSGKCREQFTPIDSVNSPHAIRLKVDEPILRFNDVIQGSQHRSVPNNHYDDFILQRKEKLFSYHLAVVTDDINSGINTVVRGSDILPSTYQHLYLYKKLQHQSPEYLHVPVLASNNQKLSKQNYAPNINAQSAKQNLLKVLQLLQQPTPKPHLSIEEMLNFASKHWTRQLIPQQLTLNID